MADINVEIYSITFDSEVPEIRRSYDNGCDSHTFAYWESICAELKDKNDDGKPSSVPPINNQDEGTISINPGVMPKDYYSFPPITLLNESTDSSAPLVPQIHPDVENWKNIPKEFVNQQSEQFPPLTGISVGSTITIFWENRDGIIEGSSLVMPKVDNSPDEFFQTNEYLNPSKENVLQIISPEALEREGIQVGDNEFGIGLFQWDGEYSSYNDLPLAAKEIIQAEYPDLYIDMVDENGVYRRYGFENGGVLVKYRSVFIVSLDFRDSSNVIGEPRVQEIYVFTDLLPMSGFPIQTG